MNKRISIYIHGISTIATAPRHQKDQENIAKPQTAMNNEIHGSLFSQIHHVLPYAHIGPAWLWRADAFGTMKAREQVFEIQGLPGVNDQTLMGWSGSK